MSTPVSEDLRSRARLLFIAAMVVDFIGIGVLVSAMVSGREILDIVPIFAVCLLVAGALIFGSLRLRQQAVAAENREE